jgi:hypothetical protein
MLTMYPGRLADVIGISKAMRAGNPSGGIRDRDPALAEATTRGWRIDTDRPAGQQVREAIIWVRGHPRVGVPPVPARLPLLQEVFQLTGHTIPDDALTWSSVDVFLLAVSRDLMFPKNQPARLHELARYGWEVVYEEQILHVDPPPKPRAVFLHDSSDDDMPATPYTPTADAPAPDESPVRPPGAAPDTWQDLCAAVAQLAATQGAAGIGSARALVDALYGTMRQIPLDDIGPFFQRVDRELAQASAKARQDLGPAAPSYHPTDVPAIPAAAPTEPRRASLYKASRPGSQPDGSPGAPAVTTDFLSSQTGPGYSLRDDRQPSEWDVDRLREGLPECFGATRHIVPTILAGTDEPYAMAGDEIPGVDRDAIRYLLGAGRQDQGNDGTDRPADRGLPAGREALPHHL